MTFFKPLTALSVALILAGCSQSSQPDAVFNLTVAHINDTHSNFDPVKSSFEANGNKVYNEFGGYPRLLTMADEYQQDAKQRNDSFLFLHGGDAWQGSAYFKLNQGAMNAELLSKMNIDAMALGNHEFDLNNKKLNKFIGSINFPVLAANIDASEDADLKDQTNLRPFMVYAFDGNQKAVVDDLDKLPTDKDLVAVFGIVLDDMANISPNTGDVQFFNMVESAQTTVDMLKAKGINNIVAVTHIGNSVDVDIASKVNGIDLIVGGHSHTLLGDFTNLGMNNDGIYAQLVRNPNGVGQTCVVQAGQYAQAIGRLQVGFNQQGDVVNCNGRNTLLSNDEFYTQPARQKNEKFDAAATQRVVEFIEQEDNIEITDEDANMRNLINVKYKPAVDKAYGKTIAQVPVEIIHERRPGDRGTDKHGSDVAPLIAEGQYYWANTAAVQKVTGMKVDFALIGAGGIRTNIEAGEYREGNVSLEMLPFSNFMSVLPVKGSAIKALIDSTVTATLPEGSHAGKFPYGGHIRYSFTETKAQEAGKLDAVEIMTGTEANPVWTKIDNNKVYNIALNNYNATGNDGWTPLYEAQKNSSGRVDLAYVDGKLTGYDVKNIAKVGNKYKVNYQGAAPNCKAANTVCNTDAQAMIDYIAAERQTVMPLNYEVVTFNRAQ
ncbi:bifunctional metallophosphatase/5'-nucleotidase [Photobacterium frigidiphilum]|uniref:Bifunctional metallophosphatase/5'-nucleotidase n=1 Tax=Photobacterium frigidiphilum TaxID=264736 RepID=A0A2T3JBY1_9GAMM|nr:bifunctional metallophosphatase/5'-nucleotidase [Photobacterium frigidiphilum]PSU46376.1 bifunctional metallophosphatase/5'-nucleotidase [Photobacterium frigidiphilum]